MEMQRLLYDLAAMKPLRKNSYPLQRNNSPALIQADVAVVGAGMVGGTLACALARYGIHTAVVDRLEPSTMVAHEFDGRASAIALSGQRLLKMLGVWSHLESKSEPIKEIRVADGKSLLFLHFDHTEIGDEPLGFMIENRHLRAAIATEMQLHPNKLSIVSPASVTALVTDADTVTLSLEDGRKIRASLVISAEGRGSKIRGWSGIKTTGWKYKQTAIVTTIAHEQSHDSIAHEHFLPAGPFAILPLPDNGNVHRSSLVWTENSDTASEYMTLDDSDFLMEIADRVGGFLGTVSLIGPRFSYPLGMQFASKYTAGRIALVGDSAHSIHPIAGQGLNLGLRDVAALTEIIVDGKQLGLDLAHPQGIARYERWRRSDNLSMAIVTDILNRLFSNDVGPIKLSRDVGLALVNKIPPLRRIFMMHAMGTVGDLPRLMRGEQLS